MIPYSKVESLAACRMTAQQIADVLDVDLNRLKENREAMTDFYAASGLTDCIGKLRDSSPKIRSQREK
ncbi:hypothetical protein GCD07_04125 [Shigella sonnei]|nr:hypothetical protein [Shigella sonnei]